MWVFSPFVPSRRKLDCIIQTDFWMEFTLLMRASEKKNRCSLGTVLMSVGLKQFSCKMPLILELSV